jgi:hypothetical protein
MEVARVVFSSPWGSCPTSVGRERYPGNLTGLGRDGPYGEASKWVGKIPRRISPRGLRAHGKSQFPLGNVTAKLVLRGK